MSLSKRVGRFHIDVGPPSPAWVRIKYGGIDEGEYTELHLIHPEELRDLQFAIKCALRELKRMGEVPP